jgi:hypothetical protein
MAGGFIGTKDGFEIFNWENVHSGNETKQVFIQMTTSKHCA